MVCGSKGSPGLSIGLPFANTVFCVALAGMTGVQGGPVLARSIRSLDIPGMPVFMDAKNRLDYNLNLLNWPFLTSCLIPPEM